MKERLDVPSGEARNLAESREKPYDYYVRQCVSCQWQQRDKAGTTF